MSRKKAQPEAAPEPEPVAPEPAQVVTVQGSLDPQAAVVTAEATFREASEKAAAGLVAKQEATDASKEAQEYLMRCWQELVYRRNVLKMAGEDGQQTLPVAEGGAA